MTLSFAMRLLVRLLVPGLLWSTALSAQTLSQTFTFGSADFSEARGTTASFSPVFSATAQRFDAGLGQLEQVTLNYSFTFAGTKYNDANPGGFGVSASATLTWDGATVGSSSMGSGGGGGPFAELPFSLTLSDASSGPATFNLEDVLGPGTASLNFSAQVVPPADASVYLDSGTLTLTYAYASAIPEPSAYTALFGLGALAGAVAWRASRRPPGPRSVVRNFP